MQVGCPKKIARLWVLHNSFGRERERPDGRCLLPRRNGNDDRGRAELIAERLRLWKSITT